MKPTCEGVIYMLGGLIRMADFLSDFVYFMTQDFYTEWLRILSFTFIIAPTLIFFFIGFFTSLCDFCRGRLGIGCTKLCLGLLLAIFDPIGIALCGFGIVIIAYKTKKFDFFMIEALARAAGLVEGIAESLPQVLIQGYNNLAFGNWTLFTTLCISFSAGSFIYTCIKLTYALDRMNYYEEKGLKKQKTILSAQKRDEMAKNNDVQVVNLEEYADGYFNNDDSYY